MNYPLHVEAFGYQAMQHPLRGSRNTLVGWRPPKRNRKKAHCKPGWHLVIDGRIPTVQCDPAP